MAGDSRFSFQTVRHQVGLELEQDGTAVQGVLLMMGERILLTGTYTKRELPLVREKTEDGYIAD